MAEKSNTPRKNVRKTLVAPIKDEKVVRRTRKSTQEVAPAATTATLSGAAITAIILGIILACIIGAAVAWFIFTMSNAAVPPAPATNEGCTVCVAPITDEVTEHKVTLIGGRNQDENGNYYMWIGALDYDFFVDGAPLQEFFSQVVRRGFVNILNLLPKHEVFNDGLKAVIVDDLAFIMPQSQSAAVPHSAISWIRLIPGQGILICYDDDGIAGTLTGNCDGATQMVTESMPLEDFLKSGFFAPWKNQYDEAMRTFDGNIFNGYIELLAAWR